MRSIAIVGAGQAGLQLALGLLAEGYDVTVAADRTPHRIRSGRVLSSQVMFGPALRLERALGLNSWDTEAPWLHGLRVSSWDPPGTLASSFTGRFEEFAQSVDQRVKMAHWLELFASRGGRTEFGTVTTDRLRSLAATHDLTVVAAGRGALGEIFGRDPARSPFERPQRTLACVYLHGVAPHPELAGPHVRNNVIGEAGEIFVIPSLTVGGPCDILLFEAVPGSPLDCWQDRPSPQDCLARGLELLRTHAPQEYELFRHAEPTDAGATLYGAVTPVVRRPVAHLGPGTHVLGIADTVVTNDPVTGQGSNNAARAADSCLRSVLAHGKAPFDPAWMQRAFDDFWSTARHSTDFTNVMLGPLPEHIVRVLAAATRSQHVADRFINGYAEPAGFTDWLVEPADTDAYLATVQ